MSQALSRCLRVHFRHTKAFEFDSEAGPVQALIEKAALSPRRRRKHAVAAARRLAIDLWRLATKQTTPQQLGLNAAFVP